MKPGADRYWARIRRELPGQPYFARMIAGARTPEEQLFFEQRHAPRPGCRHDWYASGDDRSIICRRCNGFLRGALAGAIWIVAEMAKLKWVEGRG